ncbi:hypothetical protein THAOC_22797, partial [Thalassiosira oceanica]
MIVSAMSRRSCRAADILRRPSAVRNPSLIRAHRLDAVGFRERFIPDIAVYGGTEGTALPPAPALPERRPTDFGPRSLPDATVPKGSEDKGYN